MSPQLTPTCRDGVLIESSLGSNPKYRFCTSEVVTIRVEKTMKVRIPKHKINVSEKVPQFLEEEVKRKEREDFARAVGEMKTILNKIPDEEIMRSIRESRDHR